MLFKASALLSIVTVALSRELIVERDGRAIFPRRFGQEQCGGLPGRIGAACRGEVCGVLGGRSIGTLLAASPECSQQDLADEIIDASKNEDAATAANMVALAVEFRQCEKNTPPDFTTNPPTLRNSVFCQKAPKNPQLNGLVQAQDPANDPNIFFDPATKTSVLLGSQANTSPFGGAVNQAPPPAATTEAPAPAETTAAVDNGECPAPVTVTVTNTVAPTATATPAPEVVEEEEDPVVDAPAPPTGALDFGTCTDPTVEFGPAFEGRKLRENTFKPVNKQEFPQGSALNSNIVFNAVCNILANNCKAPAATVTACRAGIDAAASLVGGAKADAFNGALGIVTDFENVPAAPGGGPGNPALVGKADFNLCSNPTVEFGLGFDGRTQNSFRPANLADFNHGSALNGAIITKFICDTFVNKCDTNQQAIDDCAAAITASTGLTGQAFADAFNTRVLQNEL